MLQGKGAEEKEDCWQPGTQEAVEKRLHLWRRVGDRRVPLCRPRLRKNSVGRLGSKRQQLDNDTCDTSLLFHMHWGALFHTSGPLMERGWCGNGRSIACTRT